MNLDDLIRALRDTTQSASNAIADNVAGPVDLLSMGLRGIGLPIPQNPVGGSQWMTDKGLRRDVPMGLPRIIGETLGMAGPMVAAAKAPQIAQGLLAAGDNIAAPTTLNRQAGVLKVDLKNEMMAKYKEMMQEDPYAHFGVRVFGPDQKSEVGTKLARSSNWVDGVPKSTKLPGTAVFRLDPRGAENAIDVALKYNLGMDSQKVGLVKGYEVAPSKMPEAYSGLIKSPVVQHIYDWPTN